MQGWGNSNDEIRMSKEARRDEVRRGLLGRVDIRRAIYCRERVPRESGLLYGRARLPPSRDVSGRRRLSTSDLAGVGRPHSGLGSTTRTVRLRLGGSLALPSVPRLPQREDSTDGTSVSTQRREDAKTRKVWHGPLLLSFARLSALASLRQKRQEPRDPSIVLKTRLRTLGSRKARLSATNVCTHVAARREPRPPSLALPVLSPERVLRNVNTTS